MIANYIKTAFRNLMKYKGFSFINVIGLGFGVACCLLILIFVQDELSYDKYHENSHRIYRVALDAVLNNNAMRGAITCAPLAAAMVQEYPEVEAATRVRNYGFPVFRYEEKVFSEERVFWVDSTFADVFTVPFIKGDPKKALTEPNAIVLTESMVDKYFGEEDAMGKILRADNRTDYIVTGVVEDVPRNSHFHYDFLAAIYRYDVDRDIAWVSNNYQTYFLLQEGGDPDVLEEKLFQLVKRNAEPQVQAALGISMDQFFAGGGVYRYFFQKVTDIHLHSHLDFEIEPNGNYSYVIIFSLIAFGILIVACINFINLSTARSANRAKEVGIRKTVGSTKSQLINQFLVETIFMSFLAVFIAVILVYLAMPSFNNLALKSMEIGIFTNPVAIPFLLGLVVFIGFLAGTYPAFFLASFPPVSVMGQEKAKGGRRSLMRNGLVVFQFGISIVLIIGTLIVRRQVNYIQNSDLGFNKDNVVIIHKVDDLADQHDAFKQELLENPNILSASNTARLIGQPFGNSVFMVPGRSGEESHIIWTLRTDPDWAKTYELEFVEGRFYEEARSADQISCVINESTARALGFETPIVGRQIAFPGDGNPTLSIIGVVKDFHFESMHQAIRPLIMFPFGPNGRGRYLSVRIKPGSEQASLSSIEETWRKIAQNQAFEYEFFDDHFAQIYRTERQTSDIFFSFSILAVIIASLGLFGLAAFIAEQRTKEIGIRKVMGATVTGVLMLLVRQFIKWVVIANLIAWPIAYFAMERWLQNFAYKAPFSAGIFILSALVALVVAVITVSYQSVKAAIANPVDSLHYE